MQDEYIQEAQWQDEVPETTNQRAISGFWSRIVAGFIDALILLVVGMLLGFVLYRIMGNLGLWGTLLGVSVTIMYFVPLDSTLGGGQTIGKRLMHIKVVNVDGNYISPARSFLRYSVIAVPYFLNRAILPTFLTSSAIMNAFVFLIGYGGGISMAYLYIFNTRTRQSLHDLAAGTYVVRKDAPENPEFQKMWKGHWIAVCLIFYLVALGLVAVWYTVNRPEAKKLQNALQEVRMKMQGTGRLYTSGIYNYTQYTRDGMGTAKALYIWVVPEDFGENEEGLADDLARIVLDTYPRVGEYDYMYITIAHGFNIGISRFWISYDFQHSMKEWADRLRLKET